MQREIFEKFLISNALEEDKKDKDWKISIGYGILIKCTSSRVIGSKTDELDGKVNE